MPVRSRPALLIPRGRRPRRAAVAALLAGAAVLLSGCYAITGQTTAQQGALGDVTVTTELCVLGLASAENSTTEARCNAGSPLDDRWEFQQFVGYLVPEWVNAPAVITATTGATPAPVFTRSPAYEAALAAPGGAPAAPAGRRWIGYASSAQPAIKASTKTAQQLVAQLGLDERAQAELPLTTVTGWRYVRPASDTQTALPIDRPIECAVAATGGSGPTQTTDDGAAVCIASSWPVPPAEGELATEPVALRTLALQAPEPQGLVLGQLAKVTFTATSSAAGAATSLPLTATSNLPGATVTAPPSIELGTSGPVDVTVAVPVGTPPGDYELTLATAGGERRATAVLRAPIVQIAQSQPAALGKPQLKALAQQLATALGKRGVGKQLRSRQGFSTTLTPPAAGSYTVTIRGNRTRKSKRGPLLARGTLVAASARGAATLRLVLTKDGKRALKRRGRKLPAYVFVARGALAADAVRASIRR